MCPAEFIPAASAVGRPVLADVDDYEAGLAAREAGAARGGHHALRVHRRRPGPPRGPTWSWCGCWSQALDCPVLAEGRYGSPDSVRAAFDAGAYAVVVGTAITDPAAITRRFADVAG